MEDYKYCVVKDTTTVIDGSLNSDEVMLQNANHAGFTTEQVEILTQEQYDERKALEPVPEPIPTQVDLLQQQLATQQAIIDELLFEVIPSLLPTTEEMS